MIYTMNIKMASKSDGNSHCKGENRPWGSHVRTCWLEGCEIGFSILPVGGSTESGVSTLESWKMFSSRSQNPTHKYVTWANHCVCTAGGKDLKAPSVSLMMQKRWRQINDSLQESYTRLQQVMLRLCDCAYSLHYYRHALKQKWKCGSKSRYPKCRATLTSIHTFRFRTPCSINMGTPNTANDTLCV